MRENGFSQFFSIDKRGVVVSTATGVVIWSCEDNDVYDEWGEEDEKELVEYWDKPV